MRLLRSIVSSARRLRWLLASTALGLGAASCAPIAGTSVGFQYACACTVLAVVVVGAVWLDWRRTGDVMSVLALVGLFYLLAFDAGSIWLWFQPTFATKAGIDLLFTHQGFLRAEWLCVVTWTGFAIGYRVRALSPLRIPQLRVPPSSPSAQNLTLLVLYVIGFGARLGMLSRGIFFHNLASTNTIGAAGASSTTNQIMAVLGNLPLIVTGAIGFRARSDRRLRIYYRIALAGEVAVAALSGGRGEVIDVLVLALGVAYYASGRFPVRAMVIAAVVALGFVFPVLALYRASSQTSGYQVSNLSSGVSTYSSKGVGNALMSGINTTLGRFDDLIAPIALEELGSAKIHFGFGNTLGADFLNVIPHALDPHKEPVSSVENRISYDLGLSPVRNNFFALTTVSEMFLDFGLVGSVIAFAIIGSVYREINEWLGLRRESPLVCGTYVGLAYYLLQTQETFIGDQLFGMLRAFVVYAVLMKGVTAALDFAKRRPKPAAAAVRV